MEREELSHMLAAGHSLRAVAQAIQRAPSTLSRDLTRHRMSPVTDRAVPAHQLVQRWAHQPRTTRTLAVHARLRADVLHLLAHRWPPEQIAHGLPQRYPDDPTIGEGRGHGVSRRCALTADAARPAPSVPHVRPRTRNAGASSFHETNEDAGLFCPSPFPWQRGTNKNTNGLLRQYFPKGTRFTRCREARSNEWQVVLNDRTRKILNWHSPAHAFHQLLH